MKSPLMVSVSGIRGIIGESLTPELVTKYTSAFGTLMNGGRIILAGDGRKTAIVVKHAAIAGLIATGSEIIDIGICPTPTAQMAVKLFSADGAVVVSASHNPNQWNALKFLTKDGMFQTLEEFEVIKKYTTGERPKYKDWENLGKIEVKTGAVQHHLDATCNLDFIDVELLKKKKFRVVIDAVNASGGVILPDLLRRFGCEVIELNCGVSGVFHRTPEPLPENLTELSQKVLEVKADIGFATDPDGDRLAIVDENGFPIGEEYTLGIAIDFLLSKKPDTVVINASTSRMNEDLAAKYGVKCVRSKVGEAHVVGKMLELGTVIGGEGNGGVIAGDLHYGRDSLAGIAIVLQSLAEKSITLSELKTSLPQYHIAKLKGNLEGVDADAFFESVKEQTPQENLDETDGLKILGSDNWVQMRKSNTEPIIRVYAEAPTEELAVSLGRKYLNKLSEF